MGKKQTKTGGLSERELKYWLTRNSARGNCWAIYTEIENMTGHENAQVTLPSGISTGRSLGFISRADLKYVYTGYMTNTELIAIVQDRKGYYYLINTKRGPKNVKADSGDAPDAPDAGYDRLCSLLTDLDTRLQGIEDRLLPIEKKLDLIQEGTGNMNRHIGFVESVWNSVRSPFQYLVGVAELPELLPPRVVDALYIEEGTPAVLMPEEFE